MRSLPGGAPGDGCWPDPADRAAGQADAGLGVRAAATALDLGFVPVTWEDSDIVLGGDALPVAGPLITALRDPHVQSAVTPQQHCGGPTGPRAGR